MTAFDRLVALCRETATRYDAAARAVGDPGLKLQFNHLAAARDSMMRDLSRYAPIDTPPGTAAHAAADRAAVGGVNRPNRRRLGDAAAAAVAPDHLRALVHSLRDHDEMILAECRRARDGEKEEPAARSVASADAPVRRVLEDVATALSADLERLRILETLAGSDSSVR